MPYNKATFSKNLNFYLKKHGENQSDLCALCGVSSSTASGWCNGTIMPRMDKVQKIADHFGCRLSDLVESHGLKLKYLVKEWKSNKSARLYMCIDSGLLDDLEAFAKMDNMSLENEIEDILYWNIESRIEDIINEQDARKQQEWYERRAAAAPQSTSAPQEGEDTTPATGSSKPAPERLQEGK